jgi:hypothetical protein
MNTIEFEEALKLPAQHVNRFVIARFSDPRGGMFVRIAFLEKAGDGTVSRGRAAVIMSESDAAELKAAL